MEGLIAKALAGAGAGLAQSSLIQLQNQAAEARERRLAELKAQREAQSRETYGQMEQVPGAAPGTFGQRAQLSGQYVNIQQPRAPTEVYDSSSPSGTRMVADAAGMPGKGWAPTRPGDREKKILDYLFRGYDEATAMDIVDGNVDIRPDQYGDFYTINKATGAITKLQDRHGRRAGAPEAAPVTEQQGQAGNLPSPADAEQNGGGIDLQGAILGGTGPVAAARQGINNVIGPFMPGRQPFPETSDQRAIVRFFAQEAKQGLVNNDRFPVHEQQLMERMLPDPDKLLRDPDGELAKVLQLHRFLSEKRAQNERTLQTGRITVQEQASLANQNEAIGRIIGLIGDVGSQSGSSGQDQGVARPQSQLDYQQLPPGAQYVAPDGTIRVKR